MRSQRQQPLLKHHERQQRRQVQEQPQEKRRQQLQRLVDRILLPAQSRPAGAFSPKTLAKSARGTLSPEMEMHPMPRETLRRLRLQQALLRREQWFGTMTR